MRKIIFATDEYYHIYNRGVDKRKIFLNAGDYRRFLNSVRDFNDSRPAWKVGLSNRGLASIDDMAEPFVEILAYCLNPNHYHFIVKQLKENGISEFMLKLGTGYTMYFNKKHDRSGALFQGTFKAIHIDSNDYLLYLSAYVNENNFIHGHNSFSKWGFSSTNEYLGKSKRCLCNTKNILEQFNGKREDYFKFVRKNANHLKEKKELEKYLIEA